MADAIDVNYVINAKNDIFDIYGIRHMSWMNMAILVSKEPSGLRIAARCHLITLSRFKP